jgi:biotin transport system substrate-specific component
MTRTEALSPIDALWPARTDNRILRAVVLAVIGSALLTLSAKIQVPMIPVPMTMQTCLVLVLGMALGPTLGLATVLLYLAEGAAGLPVFAGTPEKGLGVAYMMGPTGGYLVGFAIAAWAAGMISRWRPDWIGLTLAALAGTVLIFGPGVLWLAGLLGDFEQAVALGLTPFLLGALVKGLLAIAIGLAGLGWMRRRRA